MHCSAFCISKKKYSVRISKYSIAKFLFDKMSGFDLRSAQQTPEEYVGQLRDILEHDCLGGRKKECLFTLFQHLLLLLIVLYILLDIFLFVELL